MTPSYNQARFLRSTMESIHDQAYPNLEHIVMDGGSDDGSVEIIRDFEDRLAFWTSEPDAGQTDALIRGFERSTGDILCWLNSDDLFEPHTLMEVGSFFRDHPEIDFVYGDATWIDAEGRVLKRQREHGYSRFIWVWAHNYLPQPSVFWRRGLYEAVGGLNPEFDLAMDADLWARFMESTTPAHRRRLWSRMRFYPEQKNTRMRAAGQIEVERIRDRYRTDAGPLPRVVLPRLSKAIRVGWKLASGCYDLAEIATNARSLAGGRTWEQRAADDDPG